MDAIFDETVSDLSIESGEGDLLERNENFLYFAWELWITIFTLSYCFFILELMKFLACMLLLTEMKLFVSEELMLSGDLYIFVYFSIAS